MARTSGSGFSGSSEIEAIAEHKRFRALLGRPLFWDRDIVARIKRNENNGLCHCGHNLYGWDHCPACGCEQFQSYCGHIYCDSPIDRLECDCAYHAEIARCDECHGITDCREPASVYSGHQPSCSQVI